MSAMRALVLGLATAFGVSRQVAAQQPVDNSLRSGVIAGVVRDSTGNPLVGVEVSIAALRRRQMTRADGAFRFDSVAQGSYSVRARRVGFGPLTLDVAPDSGANVFVLRATPQQLPPVLSSAAAGGLSGVIRDASNNGLEGAEVRVAGSGQVVSTDSRGVFFIAIKPGSYVVVVRREGYRERIASANVPPDSGRHIELALMRHTGRKVVREAWNTTDFSARLAWRALSTSRVYTRDDMLASKLEWVNEAIAMSIAPAVLGPGFTPDADCAGIVNGGPDIVDLSTLTVEDVEAVEVYVGSQNRGRSTPAGPPSRLVRGASGQSRARVPLGNTDRAIWADRTKSCALVYVWLR